MDDLSSYSVSVVIPAYNAQKHISRALDSVLAQTRPADEIIVVDDGSTDGTGSVVQRYGDKVRLLRQDNAGAAVARNAGIKAARSEWIAFLDADDEWLPEKLEIQLSHLQRNPGLVWTCGNFYQCWCEEGKKDLARDLSLIDQILGGKEHSDNYFAAYLGGIYAWTSTVLVRREVFEQAGLFEVGRLRAQDTDMWFRIAYREPRIGYVAKPLAIYHRGVVDSITKTHNHSRIIGDLVERHLQLSAELKQIENFRPCGAKMLRVWIREIIDQGRGQEVLELTERFKSLLDLRFKTEMRLRVKCPSVAPFCLGISAVWKKFWRGSKRLFRTGNRSDI